MVICKLSNLLTTANFKFIVSLGNMVVATDTFIVDSFPWQAEEKIMF